MAVARVESWDCRGIDFNEEPFAPVNVLIETAEDEEHTHLN